MKAILAQLKEYWFLIVFVIGATTGLVSLVVSQYVSGIAMTTLKSDAAKLYIQTVVTDQLTENGVPSDAVIAEIGGKVDLNAAGVTGNHDDIVLTQTQLQDVARILMQPNE